MPSAHPAHSAHPESQLSFKFPNNHNLTNLPISIIQETVESILPAVSTCPCRCISLICSDSMICQINNRPLSSNLFTIESALGTIPLDMQIALISKIDNAPNHSASVIIFSKSFVDGSNILPDLKSRILGSAAINIDGNMHIKNFYTILQSTLEVQGIKIPNNLVGLFREKSNTSIYNLKILIEFLTHFVESHKKFPTKKDLKQILFTSASQRNQ